MMLRLMTAAALVVAVAPASAQPAPGATGGQQQANPTPAPSQKKICHSEFAIGSIMPHRTCRTAAEWQEINAENARALEEIRNRQNNAATMGAPRGE